MEKLSPNEKMLLQKYQNDPVEKYRRVVMEKRGIPYDDFFVLPLDLRRKIGIEAISLMQKENPPAPLPGKIQTSWNSIKDMNDQLEREKNAREAKQWEWEEYDPDAAKSSLGYMTREQKLDYFDRFQAAVLREFGLPTDMIFEIRNKIR